MTINHCFLGVTVLAHSCPLEGYKALDLIGFMFDVLDWWSTGGTEETDFKVPFGLSELLLLVLRGPWPEPWIPVDVGLL